MHRETYQNDKVAMILNQNFIAVKVDHELDPDLVFFSPMTLWLEVALKIPNLDPTVRGDATTMLQRASREMLNTP